MLISNHIWYIFMYLPCLCILLLYLFIYHASFINMAFGPWYFSHGINNLSHGINNNLTQIKPLFWVFVNIDVYLVNIKNILLIYHTSSLFIFIFIYHTSFIYHGILPISLVYLYYIYLPYLFYLPWYLARRLGIYLDVDF